MACCEDCASKVRSDSFVRTILSENTFVKQSAYNQSIATNREVLIPFKALLRRSGRHKEISVKVGVLGSHGRIGQTIQGVGSIAIPGDYSNLRSPVRSRVYEALTPGGGNLPGVRTPGRKGRGYRCPEGFQYGGRFTDNRFSTCGQMLFDIPTLGETIRNIIASTRTPRLTSTASSRELGAVGGVDDVVVRRAAQIPRAGAEDKAKKASAISAAVDALGSSNDGAALLVRADGFTLMPVVSSRVLRTIPDNRNMENAAYVVNVTKPASIGKDELGLLSNSGVNEIYYALPNGSRIGIRKKRQLSIGERRKLGRTVNSVSTMSTDADPASRLRALVAEMGNGMEYFEDFKNIDAPNDMLDARVGNRKTQIRRWAKEAFESRGKKKITQTRERQAKPSRVTVEKATGINDAVAMLDDNKSPFDIASGIVSQALKKSKAYKARKAGNRTVFQRGDGAEFIETASNKDYQHLGERVYADVANYLGIDSPDVGFVGAGVRRGTLSESPQTSIPNGDFADNINPIEVDKPAVTRIAALDWLLDVRDRDGTTLSPYKSGTKFGLVAGMTGNAGASGLSPAEIRRREALKLNEFYTERRLAAFKEYYEELTDKQREQMLRTVDSLLQRARAFSWDDYVARLSIDGELSDAEKRHLGIIKRIYDTRLDALKTSRERFVEILGR